MIRLRQLMVLTIKELRQVARDRVLLGFVIYVFSGHIIISTLGASFSLRRTPTLVVDASRSAESRELAARFQPPYFTLRGADPPGAHAGDRALEQGRARMVLEFPADFARVLGRGAEPAGVQLRVDTSKVLLGYLASAYAASIAERFGHELAAARLARLGLGPPPRIESRQRTWFNFTLDDRWSMSVFILLSMMTVACVMLPAAAAVREKERGTIEQLLVSPLTPLQIMVAKVLAMVLVTLLGTLVAVYGILRPLFGVPLRGSALLFFVMVALYAFTMSGLGLALATLARSSAQVGLLVILTVMPVLQLSGTVSPVESMPRVLRGAVELSPLHHFLQITYGIVFRGEGLATLWPSAAAMLALGAALFALGVRRFRRHLV